MVLQSCQKLHNEVLEYKTSYAINIFCNFNRIGNNIEMVSSKNLLYVLITAKCPLSCSFCMTKHLIRNQDLYLNDNAIKSLYNLSILSNKVCISGEGDPLANSKGVLQIIKSNPHRMHYELITSSFWSKPKTESFINELSLLCKKSESTLAYRVSIDEFHSKEIERDILDALMSIFLKNNFQNISFQIRSLTGQEDILLNRMQEILINMQVKFTIAQLSEIEFEIQANHICIKIEFKPAVNPENFDYKDQWDVDRYINYLEKIRGGEFHIGLLNDSVSNPLFDITINPNGDIVLYGIEPFVLGNITTEVYDYEIIKNKVNDNVVLLNIMNKRFSELVNIWREDVDMAESIKRTNNLFWIIRNLYDERLLIV